MAISIATFSLSAESEQWFVAVTSVGLLCQRGLQKRFMCWPTEDHSASSVNKSQIMAAGDYAVIYAHPAMIGT